MSIYDELQPVAKALFAEFKQGVISLIQIAPGTGPADDPGTPTITTVPLDATAQGASFKYVRDGFALATDIEVRAAIVDGITPTKNDFIDIDGVRHKIIENLTKPAAGTKIVWHFLVRK